MSNILEQLSQLVQQAVTQAVKAGTLPKINPDDLKIEISKPNKNFGGDYSCGVALTLTRALKRPPMQIGEAIEAAFPEAPDVVEKIWLTPPGFINFKLAHRWLTNNLKLIRDQGSSYADQDFGNQERVMIEFVSVNPTGPLHVGHARGAILGSALANILTKTGHAVWCEYYVNDAGTQNRIFQEAMYNLIHPKTREHKEFKSVLSQTDSVTNEKGTPWFNPDYPEMPKPDDNESAKEPDDYDQAIADYTNELESDPNNPWIYNRRGIAYVKKTNPDYDRAIADYTRATEKHIGFTEAYNNRGMAYMDKPDPDYDRAIADYTRAIDIHNNPISFRGGDPLRNLAAMYSNRGNAYADKPNPDYDRAFLDYGSALELQPKFAPAYYNRGNAYANKPDPDYDRAISDYTSAINIDPDDISSYGNRGAIHNRMGSLDKAISDFTEALKIDPHNTDLYERRALSYNDAGMIDLARDDLAMAKLYAESYTGEYMDDLKERLLRKQPELESVTREEFMKRTNHTLAKAVMVDIKKTLDNLGINYDQWFYESELMDADGAWERMFNELKQNGYTANSDGAQWFLATKFGAEKDVVVVRSGKRQEHTYFATDFAYHLNKLGPKPPYRNFSRTINIWGGDHHGHVIRLAAAMQAVDIDPARVQVQTVQIVHFKADDKKLKLSKRKGQIVTIDDLLDEVGKDACRYEFLNRSHNAQMTFDIEQAKRQSIENPVYYIQYAHARLCSVLERAEVRVVRLGPLCRV